MGALVARIRPDHSREESLGAVVCGIDECGRGALAGPVVAAAVSIPSGMVDALHEVADSKALAARRREELSALIRSVCRFSIGEADVSEIGGLNILNATFLAMRRAVEGLGFVADHALVDGNRVPPGLPCAATAVVKGDAKCLSVAAASIVAKVHRDGLLARLHIEHPDYGWDRNAGYGTPDHLAAIARIGPCVHHRSTFAGVREHLEPRQLSLI